MDIRSVPAKVRKICYNELGVNVFYGDNADIPLRFQGVVCPDIIEIVSVLRKTFGLRKRGNHPDLTYTPNELIIHVASQLQTA